MNRTTQLKNMRTAIACALCFALLSATHAQTDRAAPFNHPRAQAAAISASALHDLLVASATQVLFVDVRNEFAADKNHKSFANFIRIPYHGEDKTKLNTHFPLAVGNALAAKKLGIGATIVLICDDGTTSAQAAQWLAWVGHANAVFAQGGAKEMTVVQQAERALARPTPIVPTA
jgi:rhodanese-related sulfurtransferase